MAHRNVPPVAVTRAAGTLAGRCCGTTAIWPECPTTVPFFDICWYDLRHRPRSGQHTDADLDASCRGFGAVFQYGMGMERRADAHSSTSAPARAW